MTDELAKKKPALSPDFYKPEPFWVSLCFLYSFALFFGCGYLTYYAATSAWPLAAKIPAVIVLGLLANNGIHLLGWLAHEGIHLSLAQNKHTSAALGGFAGSVLLFPAVGLGISHWPHHRFTNDARDPDTALQSKQQTFLRRFFVARVMANRKYTGDSIAVMLKKPRPASYKLPFAERRLRLLAAFGLVCSALWLAFYITVGVHDFEYALYAFIWPYILLIPVTGLRIYIEHAGTGTGDFIDARSYTAPLYTILLFGNNYHLEHHLYPSVPCYKLPAVHRKLAAEGYYERFNSPIVSTVFGALRFTSKRYPYPDAGLRAGAIATDEATNLSINQALQPPAPGVGTTA